MNNTNSDWFERVWENREEALYPGLFGARREGIYTIPWERLKAGQLTDPRWNTCGVFKFFPTETRQSWLYVTSGLSNAWFDEAPSPDATSGFGCEFVMETPEDAVWPIQRLHQVMVYQIGLCCGRYPNAQPLAEFDRMPLGSPIDWQHSELTHLMIALPSGYAAEFSQESGHAVFLTLVGITEQEVLFAREKGSDELLAALQKHRAFPVTDATRQTLKDYTH